MDGEYRFDKYGVRKKSRYIVVVITSDVRTKKLLKIDVYVEGKKSVNIS